MKKKSGRFKIVNTWLVAVASLLFLGWVVFRVLFPIFHFTYGQKANDIFTTLSVENKKYLEVKIPDNYPFHRFSMKLTLDREDNNLFGQVYQNELGLYPIKKTISSREELLKYLTVIKNTNVLNGELISKNQSVYFISEGRWRAFLNPDIFNKLGFDWGKIKKSTGLEFDGLIKGENIDENVFYLPNSFVQVGDELYLLSGQARIKINNPDLVEFIKNKFSVIEIEPNRLLSVGKIKCKKRLFNAKKVQCSFIPNGKQIFAKAKIIVEKNDNNLKMVKGTVRVDTFDKFFNSVVSQISIFNIKNSIKSNYGEAINNLRKIYSLQA